jgi:hypothetical protein
MYIYIYTYIHTYTYTQFNNTTYVYIYTHTQLNNTTCYQKMLFKTHTHRVTSLPNEHTSHTQQQEAVLAHKHQGNISHILLAILTRGLTPLNTFDTNTHIRGCAYAPHAIAANSLRGLPDWEGVGEDVLWRVADYLADMERDLDGANRICDQLMEIVSVNAQNFGMCIWCVYFVGGLCEEHTYVFGDVCVHVFCMCRYLRDCVCVKHRMYGCGVTYTCVYT